MRSPHPLPWVAVAIAILASVAFVLLVVRSTRNEREVPVPNVIRLSETPPAPNPHPEDATPFADRLDCNIVKIERLQSQGASYALWWTDGTATRINYPVDLYIDTRDTVDWRNAQAAVVVTVRSDTIRKQKFDRTLQFRVVDLFRQRGGRGLLRILNVFSIDTSAHVIHELGRHTIHVTLKTEGGSYSGSAPFVIGSSNPHSRE
jgi:hypothetical protein